MSEISLSPADKLLVTVKSPVKASTAKSPLTVDAPSVNALLFVSETLPPDTTETSPVKSFFSSVSVISLVPAVRLVVPPIESIPVCETAPVATRAKSLPTLTSFNIVAIALVSETFSPDTTEKSPVNLFAASVSVMSFLSAVKVVVPPTDIAPVCEITPLVVTSRLPVIADVPNSMAFILTSETFPADTTEISPVNLFATLVKVISLVPVVKLVLPPIKSVSVCETAPVETRVKSLPTLKTFNTVAIALVSDTFSPDTTKTSPVNLFAASMSVISFLPAVKFVVPVTASAPVFELIPFASTIKSPVIADVPNSMALTSTSETLPPDTTETAPLKSFAALVKVISLVPVVKLVVPLIESMPVCETAPVETIAKLLPTLKTFNTVAIALVSDTLSPDTTETSPVKLFAASVSAISFLPAVKFVVPVTEIAPVFELIPFASTIKLPVIADFPSSMALTSTSETLPPDTTETAPVKSFAASVSVIAFAPAVRLVAPPIENAPVCEMTPFATTVKSPVIANFPNSMPLTLVSEIFPPDTTETKPAKLFAASVKVRLFVPVVKLVVPPIESVPVCVTAPVETRAKLLLTLKTSNTVAIALVNETLVPDTTETAPVKLFATSVSLISF